MGRWPDSRAVRGDPWWVAVAFLIGPLSALGVVTSSAETTWMIRMRAVQSPVPVGACTPIEVITRDGSGEVPLRPDGKQLTWQDFDFALAAGADAFAWRDNNPGSRFLCARRAGAVGTVTVTYPGSHLRSPQLIPGVRIQQSLQVSSTGSTGAPAAPVPAAVRPTSTPAEPPRARAEAAIPQPEVTARGGLTDGNLGGAAGGSAGGTSAGGASPVGPGAMTLRIQYRYHRSFPDGQESTREAQGTMRMSPIASFGVRHLEGRGRTTWSAVTTEQSSRPHPCGPLEFSRQSTWGGQLEGTASATAQPGLFSRLEVVMSSNDLSKETRTVQSVNRDRNGKQECEIEKVTSTESGRGAGGGFSCEFDGVDLSAGGRYSTEAVGDGGFGRCTIEIEPAR